MSRRQVVSYTVTCDVCGDEIPDGDAESASREISWEGAQYHADVCGRHQSELGEILDQLKVFVDAGTTAAAGRARSTRGPASTPRSRRRSSRATGAGTAAPRNDVAAIRAWALQHGHTVGDRGRIPARVVDAYNEAAGSTAAPSPARPRRVRKAAAPTE